MPDLIPARRAGAAAAACILSLSTALSTVAWAADGPSVQQQLNELQKALAAQKAQLDAQQKLLEQQAALIEQLQKQLSLNIQRFSSPQSVPEFEAQYGRLWEQGREGLDQYLELRKVEPMRRALQTLGTQTWFAGLRRSQAESRAKLNPLEVRDGRFKVHPIFDWSDRDVYLYLKAHGLAYHPLWDQGYISIGDWHSTKSLSEVSSAEELRFSGLKRECGIHGLEG